jgi:hypothetical protein
MSYIMTRIAGGLIVAWLSGYGFGLVYRMVEAIVNAMISSDKESQS